MVAGPTVHEAGRKVTSPGTPRLRRIRLPVPEVLLVELGVRQERRRGPGALLDPQDSLQPLLLSQSWGLLRLRLRLWLRFLCLITWR